MMAEIDLTKAAHPNNLIPMPQTGLLIIQNDVLFGKPSDLTNNLDNIVIFSLAGDLYLHFIVGLHAIRRFVSHNKKFVFL